jgi:alanine racemase
MKSRRTFVLIDLSAYRENLLYLMNRVSPAKLMAVVKADGYGHGAVELAKVAQETGVESLAVAFLEEGIQLREAGIEIPILVFNYVDLSLVPLARKNRLTLTLYSPAQLDELSRLALNILPGFQLVVDTGMRRLGQEWRESIQLYERAIEKGISVEGAYSHFATADERDSPLVSRQQELFAKFIEEAARVSGVKLLNHISNSAGVLTQKHDERDFVRAGISIYGLQPSVDVDTNLRPILQWKTCVSFVKKIYPGYGVSYGQTFVAEREMIVATIPVGYADGYSRKLSNKGCVIIAGRRCPVIGRVCMDQFVVDVTHLEDSPVIGDEVVIIGRQLEERITAEELAEWSGTINYEITCAISHRVPRIYSKGETI